MSDTDKVTGQRIDYKEGNDNSPPKYSAPNASFKEALSHFANRWCGRCRGTGYIGGFKHVVGGRCFKCLPDDYWNRLLGACHATGMDNDGNEFCEIRHFEEDVWGKAGFIAANIGLPPVGEFYIFDSFEEACEHAKNKYGF